MNSWIRFLADSLKPITLTPQFPCFRTARAPFYYASLYPIRVTERSDPNLAEDDP
jgi:hypothetical protein